MLKHDEIMTALRGVIKLAFKHSKCKYISIYSKSFSWVNSPRENTFRFDEASLMECINFMMDNCYFTLGGMIFKQIIGVPIGVDPGPYIANLTLWYYENNFIDKLYKVDYHSAKLLNNTFRLIDDITSINSDGIFEDNIDRIYPCSLILNKENKDDLSANVLDLDIEVCEGKFIVQVFDKRDHFPFEIVQYIGEFSNISRNTYIGVFSSQIVRFFRICNIFEGFRKRVEKIVNYLVDQKFNKRLLHNRFWDIATKHKFADKFQEVKQLSTIFD